MADDTGERRAPYWWPDVQAVMQLFLAVAIVVMVGYVLYQLLDNKVQLEQAQRDLLMILLGVLLSSFKDVYGFTYGSSAESKNKGEVINRSLDSKDKIIADSVATTAATAATTTDATLKAASAATAAATAATAAATTATAEAGPQTADQRGRATLKNGALVYFTMLPDDAAKEKFLAMTPEEQLAAIGKT